MSFWEAAILRLKVTTKISFTRKFKKQSIKNYQFKTKRPLKQLQYKLLYNKSPLLKKIGIS